MDYQLLPIEGNNKADVGSLLRLFQSEYFTMDMLMLYLSKNLEKEGINDYLINKLYSITSEKMEFYIAQLCYLVVKRDTPGLERYLLDKCSEDIPLYLKIYWSLLAFGQSIKKNKIKFEKIEKLERCCEMSMVNGERREGHAPTYNSNPDAKYLHMKKEEYERALFKKFQEKEARSNYNNAIIKFVNSLIKISMNLKSYKIEDRDKKLQEYMKKSNQWLEANRKKYKDNPDSPQHQLFQGIILPFFRDETTHNNSNQIVRIIELECSPFNTRKRVPYKLVIETIDNAEVKKFSSRIVNSTQEFIPITTTDASSSFPNSMDQSSNRPSLLQIKPQDQKTNGEIEIVEDNYMCVEEMEPNTKEKINKYQGLDKFAKKIEQDEKNEHGLIGIIRRKIPKRASESNFFESAKKSTGRSSMQTLSSAKSYQEELNSQEIEEFKKDERIDEGDWDSICAPLGFYVDDHMKKKVEKFMEVFPPKRLSRRNTFLDLSSRKKFQMLFGCGSNELVEDSDPRNKKIKRCKSLIDCFDLEKNMTFIRKLLLEYRDYESRQHLEKIEQKFEKILAQKEQERRIQELESTSERLPRVRFFGPWGEVWEDKANLIRMHSPYGHFPSYHLRLLIVKGGDDLRQELIAMQLIKKFQYIFQEAKLNLWLRPYEIIVTSANSGLIEFIPNTLSIDILKKKCFKDKPKSLCQIFKEYFGYHFEEAQKNFIESLAGYSLVCYILNIKDRHNGNILIDSHGHIIHIDFGFMLSVSPGGITFESAPFKLTSEYVELMGGKNSDMFMYFKTLLMKGFLELRRHIDDLIFIISIMMEDSDLPCFYTFDINVFKSRFLPNVTDQECMDSVQRLLDQSLDNWRTIQYDNFQRMTNGIMP